MAYLGKTPSQAVRSRYYFTATGGETSLSGTDDNSNTLTFTDGNYVDVSLNGVALVAGTDYNTTTANTIGGLAALTASDVVEVVVYDTFSVFSGAFTGDISLGDNVKAKFGASDDLQIYHDGATNDSIITESGAGNLVLQGDSLRLTNTSGVRYLQGNSGAEVNLWYAGSKKLETTSTGIDVTGTVTADGLTVDGNYVAIGDGTTTTQVQLIAGTSNNSTLDFGDSADNNIGRIEYEHSNDALTFRTNNSERVRIDSSGNVGIGSSSITAIGSGIPTLELKGTSGSFTGRSGGISLVSQDGTTNKSYIYADTDLYIQNTTATNTRFYTNNTERLRIDSSGRFMVGKTSTGLGNAGVELDPSGQLKGTAANVVVQYLNRTSSDGAIVEFRKDNATVGSIGTLNGDVYVGTGDTNLLFKDGNDAIYPRNANGAVRDGAIDLGDASNRFKDLYLSNSAQLANITNGAGEKIILNSDNMVFQVQASEAMRIDSSGNVGIGTTAPAGPLEVSNSGGDANVFITTGTTTSSTTIFFGDSASDDRGRVMYDHNNDSMRLHTAGAERMRIDSSGNLLVVKTALSATSGNGIYVQQNTGQFGALATNDTVIECNRNGNDGVLINFRQAGTSEGTISVSGTTVSYNGGHLSRWSQATDGNRIDGLVKGTVMTNLDQMAEWTKDGVTEDNEQLNCMAVSSVEGDANVAGVFVNWDDEDPDYTADMNVAMTGDMVIRIAQGTTVTRGDLLMSAGDGTAKPQGDDIVRSKTIAKVTSTNVSHTYDDGSYLVPCVLMAC